MTHLRELLELAKPLIASDGFTDTRISRVRLFRSSSPIPRQPILYDAWIVANLQGRKTLYYADRTLHYDNESILCTTSGSPVECEAEATAAKPLIAVVLDLRMDELMSMAARMAGPGRPGSKPPRIVDVFPFTPQLREVYGRMLRALHEPIDAVILGEQLVTEVVYRVLQHGLAESLASLASNRNATAILHALRIMHESYASPITIEELASSVAMSESAFHLHFRKITSDSPLQYLKGVRLNKARQSIQSGGTTLAEVAQAVGYESASQFSREYKRYFGFAPSDDLPDRRRKPASQSCRPD